MRFLLLIIIAVTFVPGRASAQPPDDTFLSVVSAQLTREMSEFGKINQPPYYLAYRINDIQSAQVSSSFGSLVGSYSGRNRILVTDLKVGDYAFDNSHPLTDYENIELPEDAMGGRGSVQLPI